MRSSCFWFHYSLWITMACFLKKDHTLSPPKWSSFLYATVPTGSEGKPSIVGHHTSMTLAILTQGHRKLSHVATFQFNFGQIEGASLFQQTQQQKRRQEANCCSLNIQDMLLLQKHGSNYCSVYGLQSSYVQHIDLPFGPLKKSISYTLCIEGMIRSWHLVETGCEA